MLKNNKNIESSSQELIRIVGGRDKFEKKYKFLSPIILKYVDAIEDILGEVPLHILNSVADTKIKFKSGKDFGGKNYFFPDCFKLGQNHNSIKLFTQTSRRAVSLSNLGKMEISAENSFNLETNKKIKWLEVEVLLHELTHSAFSAEVVFLRPDGEVNFDGEASIDKRKNATIFILKGGLVLYKYEFDEFGKFKKSYQYKDNALLHEGANEYMTIKIFQSKVFSDIYNVGRNQPLNISYKPIYRYVAMCDALYDGVILRSFYQRNLSATDSKAINEIRNIFNPLAKKIIDIESLKKNDGGEEKINASVDALFMQIEKTCIELKKIAETMIKKNQLSKDNLQKFVESYNDFIKYSSWEWFMMNRINLDEKIQNLFLQKLESKMQTSLKPISEKEFLDIKLQNTFSKYKQKLQELVEKI